MPIQLIFGDADCDLCGGNLELNRYENRAKWIPNVGILCGDCVIKYENTQRLMAIIAKERNRDD